MTQNPFASLGQPVGSITAPAERFATFTAPPVAAPAAQPALAAPPSQSLAPAATAASTLLAAQPAAPVAPLASDPLPPAPSAAEPGTRGIDKLLYRNLDDKASDLHLAVGTMPWQSVHGRTRRMPESEEIDGQTMLELLQSLTDDKAWASYKAKKRLDFSYATPRSRFRCHYAIATEEPMAVFRTIPNEILHFDKLGLPPVIKTFAEWESGLVIFIGVTGSGKTLSCGSILDLINENHEKKIITIENPVELLHKHKKSMVVQREVGRDVDSFAIGIEDAMREAPDVILVGEMRDAETMSAAISAATSGHLVFATMHAESTADAPTRILDSMPPGRVEEVRSALSRSLRAVVYQKLIPKKGGEGRAVATEVLLVNSAISNMIRNNKLEGIQGQLLDKNSGCIPFEVSLHDLVQKNLINERAAERAEIKAGSYKRIKATGKP
jgi:twitching motility protein PilT